MITLSSEMKIKRLCETTNTTDASHSFLSLFVYGDSFGYEYDITDEGFSVYRPGRGWLFPVGSDEYIKAFLASHIGQDIYMMSHENAEKYGIEPVEDADEDEYVYDRVEQITLPGHSFSKVRAKLSRFSRSFDSFAQPITKDNIADAYNILQCWSPQAGEGDSIGAKRALDCFIPLKLSGSITYIDKQPVGYVCGGMVSKDTYLLISAKQISDAQGLNISTKYEHYKTLPEGVVYINTESDHGLTGVRMHKRDLRPVMMNKMYRGIIK